MLYAEVIIDIAHTSVDRPFHYRVPDALKDTLKPGDLVFFTTYEPGASHVGIYAGNNKFWNATSSRGVMLSDLTDSYWGPRYYTARRILTGR